MGRGEFADAAEQYRILVNGPRPTLEASLALARIGSCWAWPKTNESATGRLWTSCSIRSSI